MEKVREELELTEEEEKIIELEKNLILTMVRIREEKGLTQAQLQISMRSVLLMLIFMCEK